MTRSQKLIVLVFSIACLAFAGAEPPQDAAPAKDAAPPKDAAPAVGGQTAFALDLYGRLKGKEGNLFFSPSSIATVLAMTYAGARGETAAQMAQALRLSPESHSAYQALQEQLSASGKQPGIELTVANALWAQTGFPFLPEFTGVAEKQYHAALTALDFAAGAEKSRMEINNRVANQTKSRIQNLLAPGILSAATRLVLTNAVYFKGTWADPFPKEATAPLPFLTKGEKVDTPMMRMQSDLRYAETESLQVLSLPYRGGQLSMVVLLPKKVDGLPALEDSLTTSALGDWTGSLRPRSVVVFLPKFTMTQEFNLTKQLAALNMSDAFDAAKADFSGMNGERNLFLSAVVHKAFVNVNEEGTEAAARHGRGDGAHVDDAHRTNRLSRGSPFRVLHPP